MTGKFITLEGGEGSGKTSQARELHTYLGTRGIPSILTREPGGSEGGEIIRNILVSGPTDKWDELSEFFLFLAARLHHLERIIRPALARGIWVVCDRFIDSSEAYQGWGRDRGMVQKIIELNDYVIGPTRPDLTIVLDVSVDVGLRRAATKRGGPSRFEAEDVDFHERVRRGFINIATRNPHRCVLFSGDRPFDDVKVAIKVNIERLIRREHIGGRLE